MKLKKLCNNISSSNKLFSIYKWALKRHVGVSLLYLVLILIFTPLFTLIFSSKDSVPSTFHGTFIFLTMPTTVLFTLIISAMLFSFMHKKRAVDLFYSLPLSRTSLFLGRYLAGITVIAIPILFCWLSCYLVSIFSGKYISELSSFFLLLLLGSITAFTFSALIAVCSGTTLEMINSIIAITISYPALVFLSGLFLSYTIPGYENYTQTSALAYTIFSPYFSFIFSFVSPKLAISNLILFVVFLCLSIYLFKKRKSEVAETGHAFSALIIIIRFIFTLCMGVGFGVLFVSIIKPSHIVFWFGAIIGSFTAHLIIQAIYSSGFLSLKNSIKYYAGTIAIMAIAYIFVCTGFFGFSYRVPTLDSVSTVEAGGSLFNSNISGVINNYEYSSRSVELKEGASINKVLEIHSNIANDIKNRNKFLFVPKGHNEQNSIKLKYKLKNGSVLVREYYTGQFSDDTKLDALTIMELNEFKKQMFVIFNIEARDISTVELFNIKNGDLDKKTEINFSVSSSIKHELLSALKKDVLEDNLEKQVKLKNDKNAKYIYLIINPYNTNYDNPDMKRAEFYPEKYIIPDYYSNTMAVISKNTVK